MAKSYTHINNDILDGLIKLKVSGSTLKVLLAIIRYTVSFHRNQHELSNGFLMKATGLSEMSVIRAIQELERLEIIKIVSEACGSHPRTVRILTNRIVTLTTLGEGANKNDSKSTNKNDSENTNSFEGEEIKKENKENKEKERKPSVFSSIEEANRWYDEHPEELEDDE